MPSRREIANALRWRSTNYVNEIVDRLAKRGLVRLARGRGRALQIVVEDSGCSVGPVPTVTLDSATAHEIAARFISCPIVR